MGKVTSLYGKTTGKIGSIVFSTSGGETIAREYNPNVANPNTQAQVNQRARMKLMSQLSAALSPVIAMTKEGLISRRNKFVQKNFGASYALNGIAQITYENVQITEGNTSLPALYPSAKVAGGFMEIGVGLSAEPSATINRVVYCLFKKTAEAKLEYIKSQIVTTKRENPEAAFFVATFKDMPASEYVIFAYGMSDTSERASTQYGNLNVVTASDLARLVATRSISFQDYQFTQTRAVTIQSDGTAVQPETPGNLRVYVTALGEGGTVTGGGSFAPGASCTVQATANKGYNFRAWLKNGTSQVVSTENPYTFTVQEQTDLIASFEVSGGNDSL